MTKLLKEFKKKDYLLIFISIILIAFQVWLDLKIPDYMTKVTMLVKTEGTKVSDILVQGAYMLLCAFGSMISAMIVGYLTAYVSATFSQNIRKKLFEKVQSFSMGEMKKFSTSSLITRTTNDITNIQMFISMGLQLLIKAPITAVWAICKIVNKNITWSAATAVAVLVLLLVIIMLMLLVLPKFKIVQKLIDNINGIARENLTGIRVVRAFNAEEYQENKFETANDKLTKTQMFTQRMMSMMSPVMFLVMNLLTLSIYFIGAGLINVASLSNKITLFSNMIVFSSYAMQVIMSFLMLAIIFIMYPRASISSGRVREVLDTQSSIKNGSYNKKTKDVGTIEFKNVTFKYPDADEDVIKNISFKIDKGQTLAIIGSTGCGKSTIVNLLMRFYDVSKGSVLVDGIDVKDYELNTLYKKIGYVPQKAVMFSDTVNNNVSYGDNKNNKDLVKNAVKIAQADDFVNKMPKKYDNLIAQNGTNISGGQKQRLAIARAIDRNPEIYVFDDSFSALDYKTDYVLRKQLKNYTKDATNIIVAQRIGTIINADKIVVLEAGCCVGIGTHNELLKDCEVYKEIAYSQLTKEELENA